MSGVRNDSAAIWLAAATAFVNFVFTFVGLWLVERVGRRLLTLLSIAGLWLAYLTILFNCGACEITKFFKCALIYVVRLLCVYHVQYDLFLNLMQNTCTINLGLINICLPVFSC